MEYKKLEIWQLAREISIDVHKMSLEKLPKFEMFESGSQIRRAPKGVRANIVEGYGRRHYKADYVKFIIYALSSNNETLNHLETLFETGSLIDENLYHNLHGKINLLGRKLNTFLQVIQRNHQSPK